MLVLWPEAAAAGLDLEAEMAFDPIVDEAPGRWRGQQGFVDLPGDVEIGITVAVAIPEVQSAGGIVINGLRDGR